MAAMRPQNLSLILTALAAILFPVLTVAVTDSPREILTEETIVVTKLMSDSTIVSATFTDANLAEQFAKSSDLQPVVPIDEKKVKKEMSPLMVGLELGTSLDLSGNDMSTFNVDIIGGYRNKLFQLIGVGAGFHKSLGSRDRFIPLYVVVRTGFIPRPTLLFMHLSLGYSFNTISDSAMFGDTTAAIGCGINLVRKPRYQSNIILSFGYRHFNKRHQAHINVSKPNLGFAQISFGLSF